MENKKVRAMICSVNPYGGYLVELNARIKDIAITPVDSYMVPYRIKNGWVSLTDPEIRYLVGKKKIKIFGGPGTALMTLPKPSWKRPEKFDPKELLKARIFYAYRSHSTMKKEMRCYQKLVHRDYQNTWTTDIDSPKVKGVTLHSSRGSK